MTDCLNFKPILSSIDNFRRFTFSDNIRKSIHKHDFLLRILYELEYLLSMKIQT